MNLECEQNDKQTKTHIFLAGTLGSSHKSINDNANEIVEHPDSKEYPVSSERVTYPELHHGSPMSKEVNVSKQPYSE